MIRDKIEQAARHSARLQRAVYDVLGREVVVLVAGVQRAGEHEAVFEAAHLPSGLYIYRLETAGEQLSHTILLAK